MMKKNISQADPVINNYKFYNKTENPLISLVLDFSKINFNFLNDTLISFISNIYASTHLDIQILLLYDPSNDCKFNETIKLCLKEKRIQFYAFKNFLKNIVDFANLIKGKFLILIDKIIKLEYNEFHKIYNIIKGSIKNIFKIKIQDNHIIYLIRTKILRNIVDKEKKFQNFNDIVNFIKNQSIPIINYIPIAFSPDNYYTPLTYTSMISILVSKAYYTYIIFYLVIPLNFSSKNIQLIETLYEQFDYFNITFMKMDNRYEKAYTNRYIKKNAFYRLSLGEILPNLDKIIYLDADTICLKDLSNLYNLNFMGKIFLAKILTYKTDLQFDVNTGVLLINLIGMRKLKVEKKVLTLLNNGFTHPEFHDQAIINIFFKKYVGFLPPEYNTFKFSYNHVKGYFKGYNGLYDFDSLYFSLKYPSIKHYVGNPKFKTYNQEDWYYFARKSKYFKEKSLNLSNIFNSNLLKNKSSIKKFCF